jgi:hypothetical protein
MRDAAPTQVLILVASAMVNPIRLKETVCRDDWGTAKRLIALSPVTGASCLFLHILNRWFSAHNEYWLKTKTALINLRIQVERSTTGSILSVIRTQCMIRVTIQECLQ